MNYIGSKYSLLPEIDAVLGNHQIPECGVAFDVFTGTAIVAQYFKQRGHTVYANDWQYFSYLTARAFLDRNSLPTFGGLYRNPDWNSRLGSTEFVTKAKIYSINSRNGDVWGGRAAHVLSFLESCPGHRGPFYEAYCEGGIAGRNYYSRENGLRIQAIRDQIEAWSESHLINASERVWLIACLIESADRVANTASVYGAYLKHIKKTAAKRLSLLALEPIASPVRPQGHRAFHGDAVDILRRHSSPDHTITYIDPPYNHRQYAANYHILETIARWDLDRFEPRGVTGLREPEENRSPFCIRSRAPGAFDRLLANVRSEYVLFSYNNEGVLTERELSDLMNVHFRNVDFRKIPYQRFRADNDGEKRRYKGDSTDEFLVLAQHKRDSR